ncbi:uncharacterized protein [Clytia hemisphaerica]|uniref:uncharacterized protein n=1 Tax=Clytia hemisphaerica TaxID=252671 RepID=UPI0034D67AEE
MGPRIKMNFQQKWDLNQEDGREVIQEWSHTRQEKMQGLRKKYYNKFLLYTFNISICRSFIANFNFMVILQMMLAALSVYIFDYFDISFDFHVSLFVSPIVFPLAFSINTDFQRREKVLEDLANFKSSSMLWFFCMREWKVAAGLEDDWLDSVHGKVKNMMFNLREYLLTDKVERRRYIARCLYEDFSDANQLIERVRASNLPSNTAIISRVIHLLNMLCLSFERLRVVREYRSPRSIRSFNKVLILFLPIILSPYFVYLSRKETSNAGAWGSYYIAVLVAAVFGALQGVQDKLDDPFDGMSEDDIQLQTIDDWTFNNLEVVRNRNFTVGRFHVSAQIDVVPEPNTGLDKIDHLLIPSESSSGGIFGGKIFKKNSRKKRKASIHRTMSSASRHPDQDNEHHMFDPQNHPYADVLQNIKGSSRVQAVKKTGKVLVTETINRFDKQKSNSSIESYQSSPDEKRLADLFKPPTTSQSDPEKQDENQSEPSVKQKEPIETKVNLESPKTKEVTFSIETPERCISPNDSINESESVLSSPSRQPLISEAKPKPSTSSRFKMKSVAPPKKTEVIENNNTSTVIPLQEYGGDNLHNGDNSYDELIIENEDTISKDNELPKQKEFEV